MNKRFSLFFRVLLAALFLFAGVTARGQKQYVIKSDNLKTNDTVLVFTPKGWNAGSHEAAPALFLLHGWSGCWSNWSNKADLQYFSDKYGFIIITPDGFYSSWYINNIDPSKMQWRTFFDDELYPMMVKNYKLDPEKTFISGLSMGGHGAINIFLDDINRFRAAGSMSGVLRLSDSKGKDYQLSQVIGPYSDDSENFRINSAIYRLDSTALVKPFKEGDKIMLVTCGAQDFYSTSTRDFSARCDSLGIPNILIMSPGVHSWKYWEFALDQHLFIYSRMLANKGLGY